MLCEDCNQKEATVSMVINVNGMQTVHHLCEDCMKKKSTGLMNGDVQEIVSSLIGGKPMPQRPREELRTCPGCGLGWGEFRKTGLLGCPSCYTAFRDQLVPILEKTHGSGQYRGEEPAVCEHPGLVLEATVESLRNRMEQAIGLEHYEDAAALRDRIRELTHSGEAKL